MQQVHNGQRDVLILEKGEVRKPEIRAAAKVTLKAGGVVTSDGFSLHMEGDAVKVVVNGEKHSTKKNADEVLDLLAAYKRADRVLAVLGV